MPHSHRRTDYLRPRHGTPDRASLSARSADRLGVGARYTVLAGLSVIGTVAADVSVSWSLHAACYIPCILAVLAQERWAYEE